MKILLDFQKILNLVCLQAVKGCIWMFEQEQALGFSSVSTNIRMTVIKLKSGGLWVHAPIAPTKECIQVPIFSPPNWILFFMITNYLQIDISYFVVISLLALIFDLLGFDKVVVFDKKRKHFWLSLQMTELYWLFCSFFVAAYKGVGSSS